MIEWYSPLNDSSGLTWRMFMHVVETKSTYPLWSSCSWWFISFSCLHSMLVKLIASWWLLSLSSWSLPSLLLAFTCTKRNTAYASTSINSIFFHESPPYLPICGIYLPFQVNLHVPFSKPSRNNLFCMPEPLMWSQGAIGIFHGRRVILDMCLFTVIHEKGAGNWNAQFHA